MSRYLCIHCWRTSEPRDLLFRCSRCDDPSDDPRLEHWMIDPNVANTGDRGYRSVTGKGLSAIASWFGDGEDDLVDGPVCAHHPDAPAQLFCRCRAPVLPRSQFVRNEPMGLGIAGPRSAGKTVLLLTMMHELNRQGLADRNLGLTGIGDTDLRFGEMSRRLFHAGEKPHATATNVPSERFDPGRSADPRTVPQSFAWQLADSHERRRPPRLLAVYDLAGETWGNRSLEQNGRFKRYLSRLSSLIFVVDGASVARDMGWTGFDAWDRSSHGERDDGATDRQWLATLIDHLGDRVEKVDLAMVVTKADLLWDRPEAEDLKLSEESAKPDGRDAGSNDPDAGPEAKALEDLLEKAHRRNLILTARRNFRRVRLFATSSLGFRPTDDDIKDHHLDRPLEPSGVLEPLEWLLAGHLPQRGGRW